MAVTLGIDVSKYQGVVNWRAVADAGYRFAVVRATLGDVKVDETFETNWIGARSVGLLISAYHVVKPEIPAGAQIDRFVATLSGHITDLPPVLDIELDGGQTPDQITATIRECLRLSAQRFGRRPIIYTAKWFWNKFVLSSGEWAQVDLWVASYGTAEAQLPAGWASWKIWQYANNGSVPGIAGDVDLNWFNGTYEDLLKYCQASLPPAQGLRVKVKTTLNVRSGPGIKYADIGDVTTGEIITIGRIDGTDVWAQIGVNQWIALVYKGTRFAKSEVAPQGGLRAHVSVPSLNVRSGPGVDQTIVGELKADATASILGVDGKDAWGEMEPGKWIAIAYRGEQYVELL